MATIIVETGTGSATSNSYVSVADFEAYAADRGVTIATVDKTTLLIQSMDYIEAQNYKGDKGTQAQALQWPRVNVVIDGYYIDSDAIPQLLIDAQCESALAVDAGNNPLSTVERATKREKVDVIEVEYMDGASDTVYLAAVNTKLKKLLKNGGSLVSIRV